MPTAWTLKVERWYEWESFTHSLCFAMLWWWNFPLLFSDDESKLFVLFEFEKSKIHVSFIIIRALEKETERELLFGFYENCILWRAQHKRFCDFVPKRDLDNYTTTYNNAYDDDDTLTPKCWDSRVMREILWWKEQCMWRYYITRKVSCCMAYYEWNKLALITMTFVVFIHPRSEVSLFHRRSLWWWNWRRLVWIFIVQHFSFMISLLVCV